MKKLFISLLSLVAVFALAGCNLQSGDTIKFTSLPQPVYTQGYDEAAFKQEVKIMLNTTETTLAQAEGLSDVVISGLDLETVGSHTLVIVYKSVSLTYNYQVVSSGAVKVSTMEALKKAVADGETVIELEADINLTAKLDIKGLSNDLTIYGNGHAITTTVDRPINVTEVKDIKLAFYDLKVETSSATAFYIKNHENVTLIFDNCNFSASSYCIKLSIGEGLNATIKNGSVATGWAALECYTNHSTINVIDTTLIGVNKQSGVSNNFATVVIDGNGAYSSNVGEAGNGSTYNFDNVTITAEAKGDAKQSLLSIQYNAMNNTVNFNNCDILVEQLSKCVHNTALEGNKVTFNGEVVK